MYECPMCLTIHQVIDANARTIVFAAQRGGVMAQHAPVGAFLQEATPQTEKTLFCCFCSLNFMSFERTTCPT